MGAGECRRQRGALTLYMYGYVNPLAFSSGRDAVDGVSALTSRFLCFRIFSHRELRFSTTGVIEVKIRLAMSLQHC